MPNFNAKVGSTNDDNIPNRGNFGLGKINDRGETLINYLQRENLYCMNTFFKKPLSRRWTWVSPNQKTKNEIDYIISNKKYIVTDVTVLNRFDLGSDHRLVRAKVIINKKLERKKLIQQQKYPTLQQLKQNKERYQNELNRKITTAERLNEMSIDDIEQKITNDIKTVTKKICAISKITRTKIKQDTRDLMEKRRNMSKTSTEYVELNKSIRKKIRKDIRTHNTEKIKATIENDKNMKVLKSMNSIGRTKIHKLKNKDGEIIQEKNQIVKVVENFYTPRSARTQ